MSEHDILKDWNDRGAECAGCNAWRDTAAQHCRNEEYYRSLVIKIGEMLGPEAYVSDDGSVQQDVLCAKVAELVAKRLSLTIG